MIKRIHISEEDIFSNNYCLTEKYILKNRNFPKIDLRIGGSKIYNSLEIDLLIEGNFYILRQPYLRHIPKSIIVRGTHIEILKCPLLKSIPKEMTFNKKVRFCEDQLHITILSEKQFLSLKEFYVTSNHLKYSEQKIESYQEYYSIIEPTLEKNKLLNICNF